MTIAEINELLGRMAERLDIEAMGLKVLQEDLDRIGKSLERTAELLKKEMDSE